MDDSIGYVEGEKMQVTSRFTIALHMLASIELFEEKPTSELLAGSIGANPVIVRTIMKELREAGIVNTQRGSGGAKFAKDTKDISLYDIYRAVDSAKGNSIFRFHENTNPDCEVGRNIHQAIGGYLTEAQIAMENELKKVSLKDVIDNTSKLIDEENLR